MILQSPFRNVCTTGAPSTTGDAPASIAALLSFISEEYIIIAKKHKKSKCKIIMHVLSMRRQKVGEAVK